MQLDWSPVTGILNGVKNAIDTIHGILDGIAGAINGWLKDIVEGFLPGLAEALLGSVTAVGELTAGLLNNLAEPGEVAKAIGEYWIANYGGMNAPVDELTGSAARGAVRAVSTGFTGNSDQRLADIPRRDVPPAPEPLDPTKLRADLDALPGPAKALIHIASSLAASLGYLNALHAGPISTYQQASLEQSQPTPISAPDLAQLVVMNRVERDWAADHATRSGYTNELFDLLVQLRGNPPGPDTMLQLWNRGVVDEDTVTKALRESDLKNEYIDFIKQLRYQVVPPSDLVRFMVRDAFDNGTAERYGYDSEFDQKFKQEWFDKAGVSQEIARYYWRAHWQLPSPTELYQMLHRGIIGEQEVHDALAINDFAPSWIDNLVKISYNVPGRIDVRRMYHIGVIKDHAGLAAAHQRMGYSPEDADVLAGFVEQLEAEAKQNELDRNPLVTHTVSAYAKGAISRDEAVQTLSELSVSEDRAGYLLAAADLDREAKRAARISSAIEREYVEGTISRDDAASRLDFYGFGGTEIAVLFDAWDIERELKVDQQARRHEKDLTRAEIITAYADRLMDGGTAEASLEAMGYSSDEAATLLALEDAKAQKSAQKAAEDATHTLYVSGRLSDSDVIQRLDAAAVSAMRRDSLLERWAVERENREPNLPLGTITKLAEEQIIPLDALVDDLKRRRFTDDEILWLTQLWGYDVALAQARIQLGQQRLQATQEQAAARLQEQQREFDTRRADQDTREQARLAAQQQQQVQRQAAAVERDNARYEQQAKLQAQRLDAQAGNLATQIQAAQDRQQRELDARDRLAAQREQLTRDLAAAVDARQQRQLEAQATRLDTQLAAQQQRADQAQQAAGQLTELRAQLTAQRDDHLEAARVAQEQRAEATAVRKEARTQVAQVQKEQRAELRTLQRDQAQQADRLALAAVKGQQKTGLDELQTRLDALLAQQSRETARTALEARQAQIDALYAQIRGTLLANG